MIYVEIEILFSALAVNSLYSAFLVITILIVKLLFSRLPRTIEYGLWCLVLIRLVLPNDFSISYSLGYISHFWLDTEIPKVINEVNWLSELAHQQIFTSSDWTFTWLNLFISIWITFLLTVAIKYILLKVKLARLLAVAHPVEDTWLIKEINLWRREFKIRKQIIVIGSNDFLSPFTFATFSPVIFIPKKLLEEGNQQVIGSIIAHELAHIKRHDSLWLVFQNIVQIIYCLNPILWIAVRRLNSLREEICDETVLDTGKIQKEDYGKSLLRVLRLNIGQTSPELFATFFLSHKDVFKKRVAAIGSNKIVQTNSLIRNFSVGLFAFFFLPMSWQQIPDVPLFPKQELDQDESPFPEHIRKDYQAPVLLKENTKNKSSEEIEIDS